MAEIDELSIGIEASAKTAISTIDELNKKLGVLATSLGKINGSTITGLANGVNRLSTAMQGMKSVGTADFTRLAKNIEKLGSMNTAGLNTAASSLSHISRTLSGFQAVSAASVQLGDMAKNIAKLGNKSVQTAITNIPLLATAMRDLMQTLSTAPRVSQNLIDMTNALANFTQQGSKVSVVSGTLVSGLNRSSKAMNNAKKSSMSLAAAFGKFYATYFLLIRGVKKLWGSIQSSFDYLEVLNYFDAAFGQVAANADLSAFEEMGYESADAYYGSFAKRAEEVTRKMSGFTIGENGLLQSTGAVSLGLDPSQLMNYQAMFGQMSSSMGVSSENALKLSQVMTEIGADLASVKNMDFEDVWRDMASGLAGMSRTLDKYGVNIRNVNLQQKLMELGINANIQSLNQNDKALLRAIILLENTKYAWGDLADTINQPANQLRLIQANFENLGRTIGNLFLPIVKTVLPYVNALVIAVQRLFAWLGNLIGIDISDISTSIGGADMGDILDQTDDLASGLGDAKKQADKLNKSLRQFDELKVINTKQDDGGAGAGAGIQDGLLDAAFEDAFSKYQQEWDKAFGRLENRAQEIADRIEKAFEPLKKIIQDFAIGDFFQAGKDTSALVTGIFDFFADAIDRVDWYGIGQKIGKFLEGLDWTAILSSIGNLIWQAIKASLELWAGSFSVAPIETAIITGLIGLKWTGLGSAIVKGIGKAIKSKLKDIVKIFTKGGFLKNIGLVIENFFSGLSLHESMVAVFGSVGTAISGIGSIIGGVILSVKSFFDMWENGWGILGEILKDVGIALAAIGAVILGVAAAPAAIVAGIVAAISTIVIVIHDNWEAVSGFFANLWDKMVAIWTVATEWFSSNVIQPITGFFVGLGTRIGQIFEGVWIIIQATWKVVSEWFDTYVIQPLIEFFSPIVEKISGFFTEAWNIIKTAWNVAYNWFDNTVIKPVSDAFETACEVIGGFFTTLWSGIKKGVAGAMNVVIEAVEGAINFVVDAINGIVEGFNTIVGWAADLIGADWSGVELVPKVSLGRIDVSGYALGGFPEDGWFRASHGEIMGQFDNGQSVVANNYQITEGIADAVYPAVYNAVSSAMRNNGVPGGDITIQVNLDGDVVYRDVIKRTQEQSGRTFGGRLVLADEVF